MKDFLREAVAKLLDAPDEPGRQRAMGHLQAVFDATAWKPGKQAMFRGIRYELVCRGDRPGTFDLQPVVRASGVDSWRNVPPSELEPILPTSA